MNLRELQKSLKEIRTIVNSNLPITFDELELYNIYQEKVDIVVSIVKEFQDTPRRLPTQLISVADAKEKEFITVKEFQLLYSYGASWQKERRSRVHNPLPTISQYRNKVLYNHQEVKAWLDNEVFK